MKFKYIFFALAVFLLAGVFIYYNKRDLGLRSGSQTYTFSQLDPKEAAQIRFRGEGLKSISPLHISFEEILDEHYRSLVRKKEELLLAAALEQFGLKSTEIKVGWAKPSRSVKEICNQYGFRCPAEAVIQFEPLQKVFLQVDGKSISVEQVKADSVLLRAAQSEVLDHLLNRINEKIRLRTLYALAKEKNLNVQDYVDQNVIREQEVLDWANAASLNYSTVESEQMAYSRYLYQQHKDRVVTNFIIERYVQKPIVINIQRPQFNFENRWEWTPFFGMAPRKNSVHVILFYNYFSDASRKALKMLLGWRTKKIDFTIGFRPSFSMEDRMQLFLTEYLFCAWLKNPDDYWKLIEKLIDLKNDFTEEQVNQIATQIGINAEPIKKCTIARESKDIVDYHLKTAEYLRLNALPVLFIGNEVRVGPIDVVEFERILQRQ